MCYEIAIDSATEGDLKEVCDRNKIFSMICKQQKFIKEILMDIELGSMNGYKGKYNPMDILERLRTNLAND